MARFPMGVPYGWKFDEEYENFQRSKNSLNWKKARVTYRENDGLVILSDSQFEELQKRFEERGRSGQT